MMARRFESGFYLIERCQRELPGLAEHFTGDSAMRAALGEVVQAAAKVDNLLRMANAPRREGDLRPDVP
jgi:hypothetical protein